MSQLVEGPIASLDLIEQIQRTRPGTTKQGVYAVLRDLKSQDVVLLNKGMVSLNMTWVDHVAEYVARTQEQVHTSPGHFLNLQDGEKVQYTFRDPASTDVFWNHVLQSLNRIVPTDQPFFSYCPHVWFFVAHAERERALRDQLNKRERQYLVLGGGSTVHDKVVRDECDGDMSQYHCLETPPFAQRNVYVNAIGDFVIHVRFSADFASRLDALYKRSSAQMLQEQLRELIEEQSPVRLTIFHNAKKAERFRKAVQQYFFISSVE